MAGGSEVLALDDAASEAAGTDIASVRQCQPSGAAADPRSIRSWGELLPSRGPGGRWTSCANSENRSGLACWAGLGPEVCIQTSHANQEDRPSCPSCRHLTSIASAGAGHVLPARLQRLLPRRIEGGGERPDGTGFLTSLESSPPLGDPDDFLLLRTGCCRSRQRPPGHDLILPSVDGSLSAISQI